MVINSNHIAVLKKEFPLTFIQDTYENHDGIGGQLSKEEIRGILHPDYLTGSNYPFMLIDTDNIEYHIFCFNPYIAPRWLLDVYLPPMEMTDEKKQKLLLEAEEYNELDSIQYMIEETEEATNDGGDALSFSLTLTPEEQRHVFDRAEIPLSEQDYILRLQNL